MCIRDRILLCSLLVAAIFFERYSYYSAAKSLPEGFVERLDSLLAARDYDGALSLCGEAQGLVAEIAAKGVEGLKAQSKRLESLLEGESALAVAKLRANVNHLESIVTVAPLLGLLGTVIGMMQSFRVMNLKSGEPLAITGGVGEALVATAFGLCVADVYKRQVDINIIYGNVDHIKNTPYGTLVVELAGADDAIQQALAYLRERNLGIEVIGYVARDAAAAR